MAIALFDCACSSPPEMYQKRLFLAAPLEVLHEGVERKALVIHCRAYNAAAVMICPVCCPDGLYAR